MQIYLWTTLNAYDDQCDGEDAENENESQDYFPEEEFDDSNTCDDEFGIEDGDDEELGRV